MLRCFFWSWVPCQVFMEHEGYGGIYYSGGIGSAKTIRDICYFLQINICCNWLICDVYLQYPLSGSSFGVWYKYYSIKPSGPQQRSINHIWSVSCREHNHPM